MRGPMSCEPLGLNEECLRLARSADAEIILQFPASIDLTGYTGSLVIRDSLSAASPLLTVNMTATANGSFLTFADRLAMARIDREDIDALPLNDTDPAEPYSGWVEWVATSPGGMTSRIYQNPCIVERGAAE